MQQYFGLHFWPQLQHGNHADQKPAFEKGTATWNNPMCCCAKFWDINILFGLIQAQSLSEPASRCLVTAVTSLCSRYPRPMCHALIGPVLEEKDLGTDCNNLSAVHLLHCHLFSKFWSYLYSLFITLFLTFCLIFRTSTDGAAEQTDWRMPGFPLQAAGASVRETKSCIFIKG